MKEKAPSRLLPSKNNILHSLPVTLPPPLSTGWIDIPFSATLDILTLVVALICSPASSTLSLKLYGAQAQRFHDFQFWETQLRTVHDHSFCT